MANIEIGEFMTVNSVGFIVTPKGKPDPFVLAQKVEIAIKKVTGELFPLFFEVKLKSSSKILTFIFRSEGVERTVSCFYGCDSDYSDVRMDEKVIFSIEQGGGQGVRYIQAILSEFQGEYECMVCPSDANPEWSLWEGVRPPRYA